MNRTEIFRRRRHRGFELDDAESHLAVPFRLIFLPIRSRARARVRWGRHKKIVHAAKASRAKGIRSGACAELKAVAGKCQTRHGAERISGGYEGVHKACPYATQASAHVLSNLLFRYSSVPRLSSTILPLLFSELPSCIPNPMSFSSGASGSKSRSTCRMVTYRYPIFDYRATTSHFALTINYRPPLSSLLPDIPDLIISQVIFVSFRQRRGNSERYVNTSPVHPLNCDLATKTSIEHRTRCWEIRCSENYILIAVLLKYNEI